MISPELSPCTALLNSVASRELSLSRSRSFQTSTSITMCASTNFVLVAANFANSALLILPSLFESVGWKYSDVIPTFVLNKFRPKFVIFVVLDTRSAMIIASGSSRFPPFVSAEAAFSSVLSIGSKMSAL